MSEFNARCDICGRQYKICRSCQDIKSFQPWRTVTDTLEHYAIYLVLTEYSKTKNKDKARKELLKCNLSNKDEFNDNIKSVIEEILKEDEKVKSVEMKNNSVNISKSKNFTDIKKKNNDIE